MTRIRTRIAVVTHMRVNWGPVHTNPLSFENASDFRMRFRRSSTLTRWKTEASENAFQVETFSPRPHWSVSFENASNVFRPHHNRKTAFSNVSTLESVLEKLRFRRPHYNRKTAFSNLSILKSVLEKLRFPPFSVTEDAGLVWTKGLTVSTSIRFQTKTVSSSLVWTRG